MKVVNEMKSNTLFKKQTKKNFKKKFFLCKCVFVLYGKEPKKENFVLKYIYICYIYI